MDRPGRALSDDTSDIVGRALDLLDEHRTLGRYELLKPIGRGGMAIVWAARQRGTRGFSKIVAVKTMLPALSADPRFERMFLAEAELASRIVHPNVCEILDLGEQSQTLYLVMEYVDGESLARLVECSVELGKTIPHAVSARLVAQAARGLAAAHELRTESGELYGVVHRDVSPQNILVRRDGTVKIVDFGVAKATQRSDQRTDTGFIKGKVGYLSPEQIQQGAIDARADVFALGVVLYELTTGSHPFRGATELATILAISCGDPAPPPPCEDFPPELAAILDKALAKNPDERYSSMRDFANALDAFVARAAIKDDDVAAFVEGVLGARRDEERRELREAVRAADARAEHVRDAPPDRTASVKGPPARRTALVAGLVGAIGILVGAALVHASQLGAGTQLPSTVASSRSNGNSSSSGAAPSSAVAIAPSETPPVIAVAAPPPSPSARPAASAVAKVSSGARRVAPPVSPPVASTVASSAPERIVFRRPGF